MHSRAIALIIRIAIRCSLYSDNQNHLSSNPKIPTNPQTPAQLHKTKSHLPTYSQQDHRPPQPPRTILTSSPTLSRNLPESHPKTSTNQSSCTTGSEANNSALRSRCPIPSTAHSPSSCTIPLSPFNSRVLSRYSSSLNGVPSFS